MTILEQMRAVAAAENRAARKTWDQRGKSKFDPNAVSKRIQPMLGTGISQREAARRLGCSAVTVCNVLKKYGWEL